MPEIEISFTVLGHCTQTIKLKEDCPLTKEEIIDSLNGHGNHTVATTVQQNGQLVMYKDGDEVVLGDVVNSDVDAEYKEFYDPNEHRGQILSE